VLRRPCRLERARAIFIGAKGARLGSIETADVPAHRSPMKAPVRKALGLFLCLPKAGSLKLVVALQLGGSTPRKPLGEDAFGLDCIHDAYEIGMINWKLFSQSMRSQREGVLGEH
jgi:hypothetical protein